MQMPGNNELIIFTRGWTWWKERRFASSVINESSPTQVCLELKVMIQVPKFSKLRSAPDFLYMKCGKPPGLNAIRVDGANPISERWYEVVFANTPGVSEVMADRNVTILPSHLSLI